MIADMGSSRSGARIGSGMTPTVGIAVAVLLTALVAQVVLAMQQMSVTVDEIMYIAAGYYHVETGDFRFNMTNTPLLKVVAAFPLLFLDLELPRTNADLAALSLTEQWQYSRDLLYANTVDADRILFLARIPIVVISVLLAIYVFRWSRELYGESGGLVSLFLFAFSPNMLAHSGLATHDVGLAAFMLISTYYFARYMREAGLRSLLLCGLFAGLALLTKSTAIFLAPAFAAYVLFRIWTGRETGVDLVPRLMSRIPTERPTLRKVAIALQAATVIAFVVVIVVNAGYGFQGTLRPWPLPGPFVEMVKVQAGTVAAQGNTYFAGQLYPNSAWFITPASWLIKTPIPFLIVTSVGLAISLSRWRELEDEVLILALVATLMLLFSVVVISGVGLRYALPALPLLHVLAGRVVALGTWRPRLAGAVGLGVALWYMAGTAGVYPHYLSYFNEFVGGPAHGYEYLSDSNVDWGQDLKALAAYMEEQDLDRVHLGYFGSADAEYHGIDYDYLPSVGLRPRGAGGQWWYDMTEPAEPIELEPGVYAISASLLASFGWMRNRFYDAYETFRGREPDDIVGYSILIFDLR